MMRLRCATSCLAFVFVVAACSRAGADTPSPADLDRSLTASAVPGTVSLMSQSATETATPIVEPFGAAEFWERAVSGDPEAIDFGSLRGMISAVDVIVVATPTRMVKGRDVIGNAEGDTGFFATMFVSVDEILGGRIVEGDGKELKVELFMGAADPTQNDYQVTFARYAASLPSERAALFLTNKGKYFERHGLQADDPGGGFDYYMLASGQSYIRDVVGKAEPWSGGPSWLESLHGQSFADVVSQVTDLAAK
jgi:hypothetical protein